MSPIMTVEQYTQFLSVYGFLSLIGFGLVYLFAKNIAFKMAQIVSTFQGVTVQRTKAWENLATLQGLVMLGMAAVFALMYSGVIRF
jgi:hypothetical protein